MQYRKFEDIPVWNEAKSFVNDIYNLIYTHQKLQKDYSLVDQLKRASYSIMLNIAEGFERGSNKEFANFLNIAKGSAGEVRSILYILKDNLYVEEKDLYFVAVKIFLTNGNNLLITKDRFGSWDIPGGRLREMDFLTPLEEVVERKVKEELGDLVKYELGKPVVFMRHERDEILSSGGKEKRRIFAIGYGAKYLEGDLSLGKNHEKYEWVDINTFRPEDYFDGGWLSGVKEFQSKFKNNLV